MIALTIEGKMPDSVELSEKIAAWACRARARLFYHRRLPLGSLKQVLDRADYLLSFPG